MSLTQKVLFSAPENGRSIEGLISMLRKTSPGGMAELADRGGRIGGKPMADDDCGPAVNPNASRVTKTEKC